MEFGNFEISLLSTIAMRIPRLSFVILRLTVVKEFPWNTSAYLFLILHLPGNLRFTLFPILHFMFVSSLVKIR